MNRKILILLIMINLPLFAEPQRHITFDDLYRFKQIESIALSPDGKDIVFEVAEYNLENGNSISNLWLVSTQGGAPVKFTNSGYDSNPLWSADGENIAFISSRTVNNNENNSSQIWLIPAFGGEAVCLTDISTGASGLRWSGDNKSMLFKSKVYPDCLDDDCNKKRDKEMENTDVKAKLYDNLLFRHYKYWANGKRNHIILHDIQNDDYEDITPFDKDAPPKALAPRDDYCFSLDGSEICFSMNTDTVVAVSTNNDIFTLSKKSKHLTRISTGLGNDNSPSYSPNGRFIAYKSMGRAEFESDQYNLMSYNRVSKEIINLTADFDRSIGEFIWGPYSKYIYFTAIDKGKSKIYRLTVKNQTINTLVDDAVCWCLQISGNGNYLYYIKSTTTQPYEIYEYNSKTDTQTRLTFFSDSLLSNLKIISAEDFWFAGADGDSIHGLLTLPPDFDPTIKYPLVLLIHGGPQWCWLADFNYYGWNTQLTAAQGYVVAQIDPHGSRGYGQSFADAVTGDWGGKPYQDLIMGIDYLIEKHPYIDSEKLAALGRSYGGYMVNWMAGQTDRFDCLISMDGIFDMISDYYSTDELWFPNWEFGGPPWLDKETHLKFSPSEYVHNFKTPTLVVHGQKDYRVDVSQGLMMFTALQTMSIPSQLLYFPDEGHSVSKLHNLRYLYQVQFDWLAKWLE
ncbi:MAG: S9 family peptidase [candidate division Zixibacteria bacterium]|nr:S9 family peptidase [candidate division Zixibacteria bacterium]